MLHLLVNVFFFGSHDARHSCDLEHSGEKGVTGPAIFVSAAALALIQGAENKYEESELLLFRNMIIFDSGNYKGCLAHLVSCVLWQSTVHGISRNENGGGVQMSFSFGFTAMQTFAVTYNHVRIFCLASTNSSYRRNAKAKSWIPQPFWNAKV